MTEYLKHYRMELVAVGPVHIGSGKKLLKKEYIFRWRKGTVLIPDETALYRGIRKYQLEDEFTDFLMNGNPYDDLGGWLDRQKVPRTEYERWVAYRLEGGDLLAEKGKGVDVQTFMKDSYGKPFVPGSSIKGMLRTVLLAGELQSAQGKYRSSASAIIRNAGASGVRRDRYLKNEVSDIENTAFHTLHRKDERGKEIQLKNAVNDCLSGLVVSDSDPIEPSNLILCQKMDVTVDGEVNKLNVLRESLRPGTVIRFSITIDPKICQYTINDIMAAVDAFNDLYYDLYLKRYPRTDRPSSGTVYLGGGTGFFTKTVLYPLLGYSDGLETAIKVFDHTLPRNVGKQHKHYLDKRQGVSPHMLKCTEYRGKRHQMGMCNLKLVNN